MFDSLINYKARIADITSVIDVKKANVSLTSSLFAVAIVLLISSTAIAIAVNAQVYGYVTSILQLLNVKQAGVLASQTGATGVNPAAISGQATSQLPQVPASQIPVQSQNVPEVGLLSGGQIQGQGIQATTEEVRNVPTTCTPVIDGDVPEENRRNPQTSIGAPVAQLPPFFQVENIAGT